MVQVTTARSRLVQWLLPVGLAACILIGMLAFAFTWIAQSIAVPTIALTALLLPAFLLVHPRWRRPTLYLWFALAYAILAGVLTASVNVYANIAVVGFSVAVLVLLIGAIAVSRVGLRPEAPRAFAPRAPGVAEWLDTAIHRSAAALTVVLWAIVVVGALGALGPEKVWGAHSLGQLVTLIDHPGLGGWWGVLVGVDGVAGALAVAWFGLRLGLPWFACAIAAALWAICPARVWPSSMYLAPTFLAPLAAGATLLALRDRSRALVAVAGAAFVAAALFSPVIAVVIAIAVVVAVAVSPRASVAGVGGAAFAWSAAAALLIAIADTALRPIGEWSLFGAAAPMRALGADGALPWEVLSPPTLLPQLFGVERHAGSVFWLCIAPGWALVASAIAAAVLVPREGGLPLRRWIGWTVAAALYAALPSHLFGVGLPSLANLLAALGSPFAGAAIFGQCAAVACALAAAPAIAALVVRPGSVARALAALTLGVLAVWAVLPTGPTSSPPRSDAHVDVAIQALDYAGGGAVMYYPLLDADSPRALVLRYAETLTGKRYANFSLSARDRAELADISNARVVAMLRSRGIGYILFDADAYARPLVPGDWMMWAWLPPDLETSPLLPPLPPSSLIPVAVYLGGSISLYRL